MDGQRSNRPHHQTSTTQSNRAGAPEMQRSNNPAATMCDSKAKTRGGALIVAGCVSKGSHQRHQGWQPHINKEHG